MDEKRILASGEAIKNLIATNGMKLAAIAHEISRGRKRVVYPATLISWTKPTANPRLSTLQLLANFFNVTIEVKPNGKHNGSS